MKQKQSIEEKAAPKTSLSLNDAVARHMSKSLDSRLKVLHSHYPGQTAAALRMAIETVFYRFFNQSPRSNLEVQTAPGVTWFLPQRARQRRICRALSAAARRLCRSPRDIKRLVQFLITLIMDRWPRSPSGTPFDPATHFDLELCRSIVSTYLNLNPGSRTLEACIYLELLQAVIYDEELRLALLRLADDGDKRRKGRQHLQAALTAIFKQVHRPISRQERVTNAMLLNYPEVRGQKDAWLASELHAHNVVPSGDFDKAPQGKSTTETMIRRGRRSLKHDYGLD